jgi:type IV pilus assembly protein PilP
MTEAADTPRNEDPQGDIELNFEVIERDYDYTIEGRADPFIPFFTGEKNTSQEPDPNAIVESTERLTGMQLFEPGQLTLVALMKVKGSYVAMVEDFKGQGYIIEDGTKIGRRGVVKDIVSNKVLIEETAMTRAGKELRNEIVMALRKEGEE